MTFVVLLGMVGDEPIWVRIDLVFLRTGLRIGASAIKCGSGDQSILNVGVSCSRTGIAERYRDFLY